MTYQEKILDLESGEIIFRDYTAEEIAAVEAAQAEAEAQAAAEAAAAAAKAAAEAKLEALGLTKEDLQALGL
jgi:hypothetical protein